MKLKRIKYLISFFNSSREVVGYAVEDSMPVRICVRRIGYKKWGCDHYDSGYCFGGYQSTKLSAALYGLAFVEEKLNSGAWDRRCAEM